jgi:hypothetical protein
MLPWHQKSLSWKQFQQKQFFASTAAMAAVSKTAPMTAKNAVVAAVSKIAAMAAFFAASDLFF